MSRSEAVAVPGGVRGEEGEVELVGVGFEEVFVLDGGVLAVEEGGAGEVRSGGDRAGGGRAEDGREGEGEGVGGGGGG